MTRARKYIMKMTKVEREINIYAANLKLNRKTDFIKKDFSRNM